MKRTVIFFFLVSVFNAKAQEPGWWTKQKKDCGLDSKLAYNTWVAQGMPCNTRTQPNNTGPSYEELQRKRKAEETRLAKEEADKKEKAEADAKAEAKKKKEEEEKFQKEKDDALKRMKGTSSSQTGIKGGNSYGTLKESGSNAFGIKSVKETGIEKKETDKETRSIETAWKQLYCAKDILKYMTADLAKIGTGNFSINDLNNIKYLSIEIDNALNGTPMGVQCDTKNIPPAPADQLTIDNKKQSVSNASKATVTIGEKYVKANNQLQSLQNEYSDFDKKENELKAKMINFKGDNKEKEKLSADFQQITAEKQKKQGELNMAEFKKKEAEREYASFKEKPIE